MKIITLCGSTKFIDEFRLHEKRLTREGNVVLTVSLFGHSGDNDGWSDEFIVTLKKIHLRKIDMCDEIFVLNVNGYIGEGLVEEINYAKSQNKIINYLND